MELVLAEDAIAGKPKKKLLDQVRDALDHQLRPLPFAVCQSRKGKPTWGGPSRSMVIHQRNASRPVLLRAFGTKVPTIPDRANFLWQTAILLRL
jgi:hypothetical protein